jgi:xylulokinase
VNPVLVGLDVGTTSVKGVAIDDGGGVLAGASSDYALSIPRPGWAEQDPDDWWRATEIVLRSLRAETGAPHAIGLSGQMHGLVALDGRGRPLRPAILWNDQRTARECAEIEERIGLSRLIALTGNRALPGFTAPKLLWLRRHEPDLWSQVRSVMLPKDYVRLRLTGRAATELSDASGTLLLDVAGRRWSDEVLAGLELDPGLLPELLEGTESAGEHGGTPVAAGAGDQAAGAIGVGVTRPGPLSVVLGTSGVVFAADERYRPDPEGRLHAFCHAIPDRWHVMGVMLSAAGSLAWARDALAPGTSFDALLAGAQDWPPGVEGLTFLPYLNGERTPHADPDARGAFVGLSLRHGRSALVRAVLEGVAFGLRDGLELIRALGIEAGEARLTGGGARSELWVQILASVLELPLTRVAVNEGAAFGAALLGGVAAGIWPDVDAATHATVRTGQTVDPVDAWVEPYREAAARFRGLYPALRDAHSRPAAG